MNCQALIKGFYSPKMRVISVFFYYSALYCTVINLDRLTTGLLWMAALDALTEG
jgi:hypothetical protein